MNVVLRVLYSAKFLGYTHSHYAINFSMQIALYHHACTLVRVWGIHTVSFINGSTVIGISSLSNHDAAFAFVFRSNFLSVFHN